MSGWPYLGMGMAVLGAGLAYVGSTHQRLIDGRYPILRWMGWGMLIAAAILMFNWFGPATAVFAWLTITQLVWSVVPLAVAWWRRPKAQAQ